MTAAEQLANQQLFTSINHNTGSGELIIECSNDNYCFDSIEFTR